MDDEEKLTALYKLLAEYKQVRDSNRLHHYQPYEFQRLFHHARDEHEQLARQRALIAANQVGKCCTAATLIETDTGPRRLGDLFVAARPFVVFSWRDGQIFRRLARPPFRKAGWHWCYRIRTAHGFIECPAEHRLWMNGAWVTCGHLVESGQIHRQSSWALGLSVRASNVVRWFGTLRDFVVGCPVGLRYGGGRLLLAMEIGPTFSPRQVDVQPHSVVWSHGGGRGGRYTSIARLSFVHPSIRGIVRRVSGLALRFAVPCVCSTARLYRAICRVLFRPRSVSCPDFESDKAGEVQYQGALISRVSESTSPVIFTDQIISYSPVGWRRVYDFTVPEDHNYIAGGLINHNTLCAGFESAMHLTGLYPDWWQGHRFDKPVHLLAAGNTNDRTRDIVQSELFGDPQNPSSMGTGAIPKNLIGTTTRKPGVPNALSSAMIKHASGGWSKVVLMSYEQGKDAFMGGRLDAAWCDEEPPEEVWSQVQRSVFAKKYATLFLTFTPENGMTTVVDQFLNNTQSGQSVVRAEWDDAPHMTSEEQQRHLSTLPQHEREMRSRGIPMLGSGLVFPVNEEDFVVAAFDIPDYWPRGCGIDFGWDHPFAAAWMAWDRDADTIYLYDCFKQSKATPPIHASAIKRRGEWIPVFWPHDGHISDKGTGKALAGQYRDEGVNIFGTHFTNPPGPNQEEGQGGASIEAGISEMLTRMETSRFKVFSHCQEWLEERRMYHRKDGRIVPRKDDCIAASRYCLQMRRFFHTRPVKRRTQPMVAGMTNW